MKSWMLRSIAFGLCLMAPALAAAQPQANSNAFAAEIGAFAPRSALLDGSLAMNLSYEYYLSPQLSWRTSFGWTDPGFNGPGIDSVRQIPLRLDVNYAFEGTPWRPFVGAGIGLHFLQFRNNGQKIGDTEAEPSVSVLGGIEYAMNRSVSWTGGLRYQAVGNTRGLDTSGLTVTAGIKTYF